MDVYTLKKILILKFTYPFDRSFISEKFQVLDLLPILYLQSSRVFCRKQGSGKQFGSFWLEVKSIGTSTRVLCFLFWVPDWFPSSESHLGTFFNTEVFYWCGSVTPTWPLWEHTWVLYWSVTDPPSFLDLVPTYTKFHHDPISVIVSVP